MFIIDCAIPHDIETAVDNVDGIFRYRLEDLERLAERGQTDREKEASQARAMVKEAVQEYRYHLAEKEAIPALIGLREHFDQTRAVLLEEHPHLDAAETTRLMLNRLLHRPSEALRKIAAEGDVADLKDWVTVNRVLVQIFGLSDLAESISKNATKEAKRRNSNELD